ncbi:hypothetical protein DUE52_29220 [Larkinella punicea]|uniref:Uncharacterized protein n=1 Tax=Larkinella punicea TaxID=2315727 RepID=A0A368JH72_9BACT|nr:hypothetical protein DUE52_29220 [Larkinella punicea]
MQDNFNICVKLASCCIQHGDSIKYIPPISGNGIIWKILINDIGGWKKQKLLTKGYIISQGDRWKSQWNRKMNLINRIVKFYRFVKRIK